MVPAVCASGDGDHPVPAPQSVRAPAHVRFVQPRTKILRVSGECLRRSHKPNVTVQLGSPLPELAVAIAVGYFVLPIRVPRKGLTDGACSRPEKLGVA
jgi:hypothetical protein